MNDVTTGLLNPRVSMLIPETSSIFREDPDSCSLGLLRAEEHLFKAFELFGWSIDTRTLLGNINLDNFRPINVSSVLDINSD